MLLFVAGIINLVGADSLSIDSKWKDVARKLQSNTAEIDSLGNQLIIQKSLTFQEVIIRVLQIWNLRNKNASVDNLVGIMMELDMLNIANSIMEQYDNLRALELESFNLSPEIFKTRCMQRLVVNVKIHYKYVLTVLAVAFLIIFTACLIFVKDASVVHEESKSRSMISVTSILTNDSSNVFKNKSISCKDLHLRSRNIGTMKPLKSVSANTDTQIFDEIEITDLNECLKACESLPINTLQGIIATKLVIKIRAGEKFEDCLFMFVSFFKVKILEIHALETLTIVYPINYTHTPSLKKFMLKSISTNVGLTNITFSGTFLCKMFPNLQSFNAKGIISFSEFLNILRYCEQLENIYTTVQFTKLDGFFNIYILNKGKTFKCIHLKFLFDHDTCPSSSDIDALGLEEFKKLGRHVEYEGLECNTNLVTDGELYRNILTVNRGFDEGDCDS